MVYILYMEPLFDYQQRMLNALQQGDNNALILKMGQGKTRVILEHLRLHPELRPALVTSLKLVSQTTWPDEIERWAPDLSWVSLVEAPNKAKLIEQGTDIIIANRDILTQLTPYTSHFKCVVVDESTSFKNPKAARTKALAKLTSEGQAVYLLTGSPRPKGLENLWSQTYMLDRGLRLGPTYAGFLRENFDPDKTKGYVVYSWKPKPGAVKRVTEAVADIYLTGEQFGATSRVPEPILIPVHLPEPMALRQATQTLRKDRVLNDRLAATAAQLSLMLRQLASGFMYQDTGQADFIHNARIEWISELLEDSDENVIITYWFKEDYKRLRERFPKALSIDSPDAARKWNTGKYRIALMQPASGGFGLNLQDGGAVMIWYSLPWSYELFEQTIARLNRTGQKKTVRVYIPLLKGSTDELVFARLQEHKEEQEIIIEILSELGFTT